MREFDPTLSEIVIIQRSFDIENFSGADTLDGKRTHIVLHLGKLMGKFATVEEQADHGVVDASVLMTDVAPDLLVYAAQLTEYTGGDLSLQYARYAGLQGYRYADAPEPATLSELQFELSDFSQQLGSSSSAEERRDIYFELHQPIAELAAIELNRIMAKGDIDKIKYGIAPLLVRSAIEIANLTNESLSAAYDQRLDYVAERNGNGIASAKRARSKVQ
jgi:hypothetical protein